MKLISKTLHTSEMKLFAYGCTHYGTDSHDHDLWIDFLQKVELTENAVVVGLGDYTDFARTAWRTYLKQWSEEDNFMDEMDKFVDKQLVEPFCDEVMKHCPSFAEKCLVLVEGNHHYKYGSGIRSGKTSTEEICQRLGVQYGGLAAWVRLMVYRNNEKGSGRNLNLLLNHGQSSSSSSISSALGKLEKQTVTGWRNVDVLLSSHNHMLGHLMLQQLGATQRGAMKLIETPILVAKCGCFKTAYSEGAKSSSYEEKNLFRPHARGWFECTIKLVRKCKGNKESLKWEFSEFNA